MLNTKFYKKLLKGQITLNSLYSTQLDTEILNSTSISLINKYIKDVTLYNELFVIEDFQQLVTSSVDFYNIKLKNPPIFFDSTIKPQPNHPLCTFSNTPSDLLNTIFIKLETSKSLKNFEYEKIQYVLENIYLNCINTRIKNALETTINSSLVYCDSVNQLPYMAEICKKGKNDIGQLNNSFTLQDIRECIKTKVNLEEIDTFNNVVLLNSKFLPNLETELKRESNYFVISLDTKNPQELNNHKQAIIDFKNNNNNNKLLFILTDYMDYDEDSKLTDLVVTNLLNLQTYFKPLKNKNILLTDVWQIQKMPATIQEEFRAFYRHLNSYIFKNINFEKVNTFK